jgi:hypothetical protein
MGWAVTFKAPLCTIEHDNGTKHVIGKLTSNLYRAPLVLESIVTLGIDRALCTPTKESVLFAASTSLDSVQALAAVSLDRNLLIHRRFAHINDDYLYKAVKHKMVTGLTLPSQSKFKHAFCDSCALAKSTRVSSTKTPGSAHNAHRKSSHTPIMSPDSAFD